MSDSPERPNTRSPRASPALPFCPFCPSRRCLLASATVPRPSPRLAEDGCAIPTFGQRFGGDGDGCRRGPRGGHAPWRGRGFLPSCARFGDLMARGRRVPREPCVGPGDAAWEWRIRRASTSWRSDPTLRWRFCVRRRVKRTLAPIPGFWTAEQGLVWAATAEDTEGMPRGAEMGLRSRRGAKRRWRGCREQVTSGGKYCRH